VEAARSTRPTGAPKTHWALIKPDIIIIVIIIILVIVIIIIIKPDIIIITQDCTAD
jgi:hypothetical protein